MLAGLSRQWWQPPPAGTAWPGIEGLRPAAVWHAASPLSDSARDAAWTRALDVPEAVSSPAGPAKTFTGNTTRAFQSLGAPTAAQTRYTVIAVARWVSGGANNYPQLCGTSGANNGFRLGCGAIGGGDLGMVKGGVATLSTVTLTSGVWYVIVASHRQDTGDYYILARPYYGNAATLRNTSTNTSASSASADRTFGVGIARTDFSGAWNGDIALCVQSFDWLPEDQACKLLVNPWMLAAPEEGIWVPAATGSYTITASSGTYTLTGQAAGLSATRTLSAEQGAYTLTGQASGLLATRSMSAAQGSYSLSGQDATLTYTPVGAYSITADVGSYTLTGQDVTLLAQRALTAEQGTYTLTGQDATLDYAAGTTYSITADSGTYSLTGQAATLTRTIIMTATGGTYTLTGQDATLTYSGEAVAAQLSAAPIGHGPALGMRSVQLGRRMANISRRTR